MISPENFTVKNKYHDGINFFDENSYIESLKHLKRLIYVPLLT